MLVNFEQLRRSEERADAIGIEAAESALAHSVRNAEEEIATVSNAVTPTDFMRASRSGSFKANILATAPIGDDSSVEKIKDLIETAGKIDERERERTLDQDDLVSELFLLRALIAAKPICRLSVRNQAEQEIGSATGFMISPELLLTNWHVFKTIDLAEKSIAEFDYTSDARGEPLPSFRFKLEPQRFFVSDSELDYALVAVNPLSSDGLTELSHFGYHRLIPSPGKIEERQWVTIIQHPNGQRRKYAIRDNLVIHRQDEDDFMWYKSDTAQGSSGAPAFNDSFQIVALHHLGRAQKVNGKYLLHNRTLVDSLEGIDDSQVVWIANEGLRTSVLCAAIEQRLKNSNEEIVKNMFAAISGNGGVMSNLINGKNLTTKSFEESKTYADNGNAPQNPQPTLNGFITINVPTDLDKQLNLSLGFGDNSLKQSSFDEPVKKIIPKLEVTTVEEEYKKQVEPLIDNDYSNRTGYNENFLDIKVPLPTVVKTNLVSKMDNGDHVIPYEHFSIVINKARRLALFTASNVDGAKTVRKPVAGLDYSRDGLGGLKESDDEKWRTDPRIPELHQLPNTFYNEDRSSFDRGHIIRREDVCWGNTYQQIRKANGDTYHTTNCSPQVANFNRSLSKGEWGQLENFILTQAKEKTGKKGEKYCLFAGPVFEEDDGWFEGYDDRGKIRVQIPRRFWKIVIAQLDNELQSFAFILEQDLKPVVLEEEFQVNETWKKRMIAIEELETILNNIKFPKAMKEVDQYSGSD